MTEIEKNAMFDKFEKVLELMQRYNRQHLNNYSIAHNGIEYYVDEVESWIPYRKRQDWDRKNWVSGMVMANKIWKDLTIR